MIEVEFYDIVKIIHIIAIISWMAGLLYLPRIFVYHSKVLVNSEMDKTFQEMERKLFYYIMNPAMLIALICGFYLANEIGFDLIWLHIKITLVFLLFVYHHFLGRWRKQFLLGKNKHSQKFYRIMNEVPTLLMILIVTLVILKPF